MILCFAFSIPFRHLYGQISNPFSNMLSLDHTNHISYISLLCVKLIINWVTSIINIILLRFY